MNTIVPFDIAVMVYNSPHSEFDPKRYIAFPQDEHKLICVINLLWGERNTKSKIEWARMVDRVYNHEECDMNGLNRKNGMRNLKKLIMNMQGD